MNVFFKRHNAPAIFSSGARLAAGGFIFINFLLNSCGGAALETQKKIFRYNQLNALTSLDPAFAKSQANIWATSHLYDGLIQLDDLLHIQPCIAAAWSISPDGLIYTFHLRPDVYFQNNACFPNHTGRKVIASDVAYSFQRLMDPAVHSPGSWVFKDRVRAERPFIAVDDSTFEVHLAAAFRPTLEILTMQYCSVVPREAVERYQGDFRKNPVGSGPFAFKKWLENQGLFLLKNENYFEKDEQGVRLPYLDGVRVSFMPDRKTAYLEMMRGKIDFTSGIESSIANELLTSEGEIQPKQKDRLILVKSPYLNTEFLGINLELCQAADSPLRLKKVRQALNYGFDRSLMLRALRNSMGKPADAGFAPRGLPSFDDQAVHGYSYDPKKARALLAEAGFSDAGSPLTLTLTCNKDYADLCAFITRQWEDVGVKCFIELSESATLRERMTKGTVPFFRGSWIADYPDAESFYTVFYGKNPAPPNYTRFHNADFDVLYEAALKENDDEKRYAIYHRMDRILIDEAPVIFLFYDEACRFARKEIKGLSDNSMNLLPLKRVKKE